VFGLLFGLLMELQCCVMAFGEPAPIQIIENVPDLPPSEPDGHHHQILGSRAGEGHEVRAGPGDAEGLPPDLGPGDPCVPRPPHEAPFPGPVLLAREPRAEAFPDLLGLVLGEPIGRVRDDGRDGVLGHGAETLEAVPDKDDGAGHRASTTGHAR
jgi:hypothetical protein